MPHDHAIRTICAIRPDVLRLARHLTRGHDSAQDLAQEVLLTLWEQLARGTEIRDPQAYANAALRNAYRQSLRRKRIVLAMDPELSETIAAPGGDALAPLVIREVTDAIARLPANQACLVRLVAAGETSPAALARRTGLPLGTVMSRLARARARLRAEMGMGRRTTVAALI